MKKHKVRPSFFLIPLVIMAALTFGYILIFQGSLERPSPWIEKPMPSFSLSTLNGEEISSEEIKGSPFLLTFFASWCFSCRAEHKMIGEISKKYNIPVFGIAFRDAPKNLKEWFSKYGNPFAKVGLDTSGDVGFEWGVRGVPETFLVDSEGFVQYHAQGALLSDDAIHKLEKAIRAVQ